jgi:hypothetical protein
VECRALQRWAAARWYCDRLYAILSGGGGSPAAKTFRDLAGRAEGEAERAAILERGADCLLLDRLATALIQAGKDGEATRLFQELSTRYPERTESRRRPGDHDP